MPLAARIGLALTALWAACPAPAPGQETDKPAQFAPQHPRTRRDLNRREALKLYAMGLISQRGDRLLEAVRLFEKALKLDPEAAAIHKALASLYLALERTGDALGFTVPHPLRAANAKRGIERRLHERFTPGSVPCARGAANVADSCR